MEADSFAINIKRPEKFFESQSAFAVSSNVHCLQSKSKYQKGTAQSSPSNSANTGNTILERVRAVAKCKKGLKENTPNQDNYTIINCEDREQLLLGVFDGHGVNGHDISEGKMILMCLTKVTVLI
jgi:hypothetical protein